VTGEVLPVAPVSGRQVVEREHAVAARAQAVAQVAADEAGAAGHQDQLAARPSAQRRVGVRGRIGGGREVGGMGAHEVDRLESEQVQGPIAAARAGRPIG
jgi:hypothetical protein